MHWTAPLAKAARAGAARTVRRADFAPAAPRRAPGATARAAPATPEATGTLSRSSPRRSSGPTRPAVDPRKVDAHGAPLSRKAWDGQDKDAFFRDKYAHVHARQRANTEREKAAAEARRAARAAAAAAKGKRAVAPRPAPVPAAAAAAAPGGKYPQKAGYEYLYGRSAVLAALEARAGVRRVLTGHTLGEADPEILRAAAARDIALVPGVPLVDLHRLAERGVHNKYVCETRPRTFPAATDVTVAEKELVLNASGDAIKRVTTELPPLGLFVDEVVDPQNLGAILRSAHWFGVDFVALSTRNTAPVSPLVSKASAGAAEHLNILHVLAPLRFFDALREGGWAVVTASPPAPGGAAAAAEGAADGAPGNPVTVALSGLGPLARAQPTMLVVGSEGAGVRASLARRSTHRVSVPPGRVPPHVDSLNVSVAAALLLHQLAGAGAAR